AEVVKAVGGGGVGWRVRHRPPPATQPASKGGELAARPFSETRSSLVALVHRAIAPPSEGEDEGYPNNNHKEHGYDGQVQTDVRSAVEKEPDRQNEPYRQPDDRSIDRRMQILAERVGIHDGLHWSSPKEFQPPKLPST